MLSSLLEADGAANVTLQRLLAHVGLAFLLITTPRGALAPASSRVGRKAARPEAGSPGRGGTTARSAGSDDSGHAARRAVGAPRGDTGVPVVALSELSGNLQAHDGHSAAAAPSKPPPRTPSPEAEAAPPRSPSPPLESLLARPLPTRRTLAYAAVRAFPSRVVVVCALLLWLMLMLAVALRLLSLSPSLLSSFADEDDARPASWLALFFVAAVVAGHHLACRYLLAHPDGELRCPRPDPSLQSALIQTAALQVQTAAIPVAAHAMGLMPRALAARYTPFPLCSGPLHAAAFCAAFLASNLLAMRDLLRAAARAEPWAWWAQLLVRSPAGAAALGSAFPTALGSAAAAEAETATE